MRKAESAVAAVLLAVLALGLALVPLLSYAFTNALSMRYSESASLGLSRAQTAVYAEQVRAYVVWGRGPLPESRGPAGGFDAEAVAHLTDVRAVILLARGFTAALTIVLVVWAALRWRDPDQRAGVGRAMVSGGSLIGGLAAAVALVSVLDFDAVFSAFHKLFFAEGTWTFPSDSLLIRLFPEPFWVLSAASWGALVIAIGAIYIIAGAWLRRRSGKTADNAA